MTIATSPSQVPAGLRGAAARDPVGAARPTGLGCRARPSSVSGSGRRASRSAGRCATSRWPGWSSAAPASGHLRQGRPRQGRAVVRPADSRPRRDRDLRADLSGHDGVAAGAPARAGVGQPDRRRQRAKRIAPGSCASSTSTAACPACSSRRSSRPRNRMTSTGASSTRSTRRASRSCCSTVRRCPTRAAAITISSASTIAAPAT